MHGITYITWADRDGFDGRFVRASMATKARLHWFWRGTIAFVLGLVAAIFMGGGFVPEYYNLANWIVHPIVTSDPIGGMMIAMSIMAAVPALLVAVPTYGLLAYWLGGDRADGELHCRQCDHILRGLSEPRCPECGEGI